MKQSKVLLYSENSSKELISHSSFPFVVVYFNLLKITLSDPVCCQAIEN